MLSPHCPFPLLGEAPAVFVAFLDSHKDENGRSIWYHNSRLLSNLQLVLLFQLGFSGGRKGGSSLLSLSCSLHTSPSAPEAPVGEEDGRAEGPGRSVCHLPSCWPLSIPSLPSCPSPRSWPNSPLKLPGHHPLQGALSRRISSRRPRLASPMGPSWPAGRTSWWEVPSPA